MDIGGRLRKVRKQQNLTAKRLSEISGVPEKTIYRIETGEVKDPKLSSIEPLILALNCSADELLFDKDKFTDLAGLRQEFAQATQMNEHHLSLLVELVRMFNLGASFEKHISEQLTAGNIIHEESKPKNEHQKNTNQNQ